MFIICLPGLMTKAVLSGPFIVRFRWGKLSLGVARVLSEVTQQFGGRARRWTEGLGSCWLQGAKLILEFYIPQGFIHLPC